MSDVRRKTDVKWFQANYGDKVKIVRINADEGVRKNRGFKYTEGNINLYITSIIITGIDCVITGIDNAASECDLDDSENWDYCFDNNSAEDVKKIITTVCKSIKQFVY